jgi:Cu2+-containing amine oxidase
MSLGLHSWRPWRLGGEFLVLLLTLTGCTPSSQAPPEAARPLATVQAHPLDPLSAAELQLAVQTLKAEKKLPEHVLFAAIVLHEPAKEFVLAWKPGDAVPRAAFLVV